MADNLAVLCGICGKAIVGDCLIVCPATLDKAGNVVDVAKFPLYYHNECATEGIKTYSTT